MSGASRSVCALCGDTTRRHRRLERPESFFRHGLLVRLERGDHACQRHISREQSADLTAEMDRFVAGLDYTR